MDHPNCGLGVDRQRVVVAVVSNVVQFRKLSDDGASLVVQRQNAWAEFQVATRAMVAAQNRMHEAHTKWLDLDIQVFAANAAEKL